MRITITEALVKLKTLESRIEKGIDSLSVVGVRRADSTKLTNGVTEEKDFIERAKSSYQSVSDLMRLRSDMKAAIAESNAKTIVNIAGKDYTVAHAIDKKNSIYLDQQLISRLRNDLSLGMRNVQALNQQADDKANKNVEIMLGSDKAKNKTEESQAMYNAVYEKNKGVLVDAIGVEKLIEQMEIDVKDFLDSVDTQLVISNSTTYIEIED